ncbi:N-acetylmuramoyl-L-alanine amidase [Clostridium novyi A str. 4552]|uniref:N-acetylmuramoyl-L-alanine amidase n=1 Tax=Clostridium novyi A str. 4552 TaxID=1444289 RepID=A0A0A0I4D0_CLONO|nr:N-acetylmuramoyl-L-alanine amidase [Clostridium novyi]KGM94565.1 N-acetylmuramoyl-L-alanine amidase [Clostridium novyi A str. 4552]
MKKVKVILLSLLVLFTFSACKNKGIDNKNETVSKKVETNASMKNLEKAKTNEDIEKLDKASKEKNKLQEDKDNKKNKELDKIKNNEVVKNSNADKSSKIKNSKNVIVLDPGHASRGDSNKEPVSPNSSVKKARQTSGADGVMTKTPEYKVNMDVAVKLKRYLEQKGFTVIMTKTDNNKTMSNIERAKVGNNANAALVIRIHADSSESKSTNGASMLIPSNSGSTKAIYNQSRNYGEKLIGTLTREVGMRNRGVIERKDLTGFNWSTVPVVLVEMGFLSNPEEDKKLSTDSYKDKIAKALANGVSYIFK